MNIHKLIGLNLSQAQQKLQTTGNFVRVVKKDGVAQSTSSDKRMARINVEIERNIITKVIGFG